MARIEGLTLGRGNRGLLVVAAIAGLAAAVLFIVAVNQGDGGGSVANTSGATIATVVASQSIAAGTEVTDRMVEVKEVPGDLLVAGAFTDTQQVVGEVAKVAIAANAQITPAMIGSANNARGIDGVIPDGMRGAAVGIDQVTAVGGNLLPGNHVDVIGVPENLDAARVAAGEFVPAFIIENREIISVGQEAQEPLPAADSGDVATSGHVSEDVETQPDASTVTLAVTPEEAAILAVAQQSGIKISLTLRGFGE
jgi:pilus assembly protein CpaB